MLEQRDLTARIIGLATEVPIAKPGVKPGLDRWKPFMPREPGSVRGACPALPSAHEAKVLSDPRFSGLPVGLLAKFHPMRLKGRPEVLCRVVEFTSSAALLLLPC